MDVGWKDGCWMVGWMMDVRWMMDVGCWMRCWILDG